MGEWTESKLGLYVESISETYKFKPNEQVVFLNTSDILLGRVINRELQDSSRLPGQAKKKIKKGDFLFSEIRPANGRYAMIDFDANNYVVSTKLMVLRCNDKIDRNFFRIFLTSKGQLGYLQMIAEDRSGTFPQITFDHISYLDISLPPLPEQKAIASVLSSLDDKIDLLHRQNKTLETMAETLFRQWFMVEAQKDGDDGKIPDEFDYVMGASPPGESYNETDLGIPMFQGNADFEFRFPKRRIFTTEPKRFAEKYDTLISVRAPVGAQNMANEKCCIGRGVAAFRYKRHNDYYTYTYFKLKSLMKEIQSFNDTGTVFGSISKADFEAFEIFIPPGELVDSYQAEVKPIDDKVIANTLQIRTLEKLRDTLLPKLMSGKVRVEFTEN
jgi:type I restriction enzyme, S subunit